MVVLQGGRISVDGVDISKLEKTYVRSRINVVPQDPFFLPGSLRLNLDPSGSVPDAKLFASLERVGLAVLFQGEQGGLDVPFDSTILSAGQKQLLCLARAMVKGASILVLDEATSRYVSPVVANVFWCVRETDLKQCG
jgi:ABC-type multidrug transport system fused ATPase/permease subunit